MRKVKTEMQRWLFGPTEALDRVEWPPPLDITTTGILHALLHNKEHHQKQANILKHAYYKIQLASTDRHLLNHL